MKPVERFFRKYFLSMVGIVALFLLLNVVLLFFALIWAWQTSEAPELSISEICDRITLDGTGHLTAAESWLKCWKNITPGLWFWTIPERSFFRANCRRNCPGGTRQRMWQHSAGGIWGIIRSMCRSIPRGYW